MSIFFNAHHSPIGAFATLTLGAKGDQGGFGLERREPARENLYIGVEDRDRDRDREGRSFHALPFFVESASERERYQQVETGGEYRGLAHVPEFQAWADGAITRHLTPCTDTWRAGDLENLASELGAVRAVLCRVPAGTKRSFRFVIGFYRDGVVTGGWPCRYYYTRFFDSLEAVLRHGLARVEQFPRLAAAADARFDAPHLNANQRWQLALALHSYYGSTQLLRHGDDPVWVVNEGEYRMMNTFDLAVDHLYHELALNPWTARNVLDLFADRYRYDAGVRFPGDRADRPGGVSFTHDMGVNNC